MSTGQGTVAELHGAEKALLLIDVGDLDTVAATNRLYLNCTVKLTIVCSMVS